MLRRSAGLLIVGSMLVTAQNLSLASHDARRSPDWLSRATVYQVWMRAFTPEGTLAAAAARLPYLADLGVSIVYLSPLQAHSSVGGTAKGWTLAGPYGIKDYEHIDPGYGTEAELKAFTEAAHLLHLKVIMDIVFYYMAIDNPLLQIPELFLHATDGKPILSNWGRPRPDFSSPKLREYLIGNLLHWVRDTGVDGFRCDVAAGIPVGFWEQARTALDGVNREVILLAEAESPEQQRVAFDISYNFSYLRQALHPVLLEGQPAVRIRENWQRQKALWPNGSRLLYFSDNHDLDRATRLVGEKAAYAASVLNFTLDGIPLMYNGQEIGDTTPTNYPERSPIPWELGKQTAWAHQQEAMLAKYKRLVEMRRREDALAAGTLTWLNNSAPDHLVTFLRKSGGQRILVIVNLCNRPVAATVDVRAADFMPSTDLLTGKHVSTALSAGQVSFPTPLHPFEAMVLRSKVVLALVQYRAPQGATP